MRVPNRGALNRVARGVKKKLLWVFLAFGCGAGFTWYFRAAIFGLLLAPAHGSLSPHGGLPIFTGPTEMMGAAIRLAMMGGAVAAFPVAIFSVYRLVRPLLSRQQRKFAVVFLPAVFVCYLSGAAFAYFVMLPTGLRFLLSFGDGIAVPAIRISEYMSLVTALIFWLGVVFEVPLVMFMLARMRLVSHTRFKKLRKYVPVAAFVLSALITPTFDVVNQTMVAVPIFILYEVGLYLAWLARPKKEGHRTMTQIARVALDGLLRRLVILVIMPLVALVTLAYTVALCAVFVWDGYLSTDSAGRECVDLAYRRALKALTTITY